MLHNLKDLKIVNLSSKTESSDALCKSITRAQAKAAHKELPPGGVWRTVRGHHIYIVDGKVVAGSLSKSKGEGAKKATKAQLIEHQAALDKDKGAGTGGEERSSGGKSSARTGGKNGTAGTRRKSGNAEAPARNKRAASSEVGVADAGAQAGKKAPSTRKGSASAGKGEKAAGKGASKSSSAKGAAAKGKAEAKPKKTAPDKREKPNGYESAKVKKIQKVTGYSVQENTDGRWNLTLDAHLKSGKDSVQDTVQASDYNSQESAVKGGEKWVAKYKEGETSKQTAPSTDNLKETTRAYKYNQHRNWFASLSPSEQKKVMGMKDLPESNYRISASPWGATSKEDEQKVLNAFHHLRAQAGLSKTKAGKKTEGVTDVRHQAQDNRKVAYDVGEKVGGARKDLATITQRFQSDPTAQDLEELEKLHPEMAQKLVTKSNLLKPLDYETEKNNGVHPEVALAKKLLYGRIAPKPATVEPEDRLLYFNGIRELQRVLEPVTTWDEFQNVVRDLGNRMTAESPRELKYREYSLAQAQKRGAEPSRIEELLKRYEESKQAYATPIGLPLGPKLHDFFTNFKSRSSTYDTIFKKRPTWESLLGEKQKEGSKGEQKERKLRAGEERAKVIVSEAKRVGGGKVNVKKPEDMVKQFGMRAVEFGNYVNDEDGKHHLQKASEALHDLADIMSIDTKDVSLNGRLAMAFGARGKGGALAHYEPVTKVINMTRDAGAGTLAHEWGHALDNIMHMHSTGKPSLGFASDSMGDEGDPLVKVAYDEVMSAMLKGAGKERIKPDGKNYNTPAHWSDLHELPFNEAFAKIRKDVDDNHKQQLDFNERYYGNNATRLRQGIEKARQTHQNALLNRYHALAALFRRHGKEVPDYERPTGRSQFATNADILCGGKQGYWNRKHEMFARCFESYILDKLKENGRQNDYLVAGTTHPMAYPQGEERQHINKAFDRFVTVLARSGAVKKALEYDLGKSFREDYAEPRKRRAVPDAMKFFTRAELQTKSEAYMQNRNRYAYNVPDPNAVIFIPVNRLKTPYQTEKATNYDKVQENVERMRRGENLEPVIIGYDYDVHDGHHRIEASKLMGYTHIPCVVGGTNEIDVKRAEEAYREVWKSVIPDLSRNPAFTETAYADAGAPLMFRGIGQAELESIARTGYVKSKGKGNDSEQDSETLFSPILQQAWNYAKANYSLYNEPNAYVLVMYAPPYMQENELGELTTTRKVPKALIRRVLFVPQDERAEDTWYDHDAEELLGVNPL